MIVKCAHEPLPLHSNASCSSARVILDETYTHHSKQRKEQLSSFALFVETKLQQTKLTSRSILSLCTSAFRSFDYNMRDRSKKGDERLGARKMSVVEGRASLQCYAELFLQSRGSWRECIEGHRAEQSSRNKKDRSSAQIIDILDLDEIEVASRGRRQLRKKDRWQSNRCKAGVYGSIIEKVIEQRTRRWIRFHTVQRKNNADCTFWF